MPEQLCDPGSCQLENQLRKSSNSLIRGGVSAQGPAAEEVARGGECSALDGVGRRRWSRPAIPSLPNRTVNKSRAHLHV